MTNDRKSKRITHGFLHGSAAAHEAKYKMTIVKDFEGGA